MEVKVMKKNLLISVALISLLASCNGQTANEYLEEVTFKEYSNEVQYNNFLATYNAALAGNNIISDFDYGSYFFKANVQDAYIKTTKTKYNGPKKETNTEDIDLSYHNQSMVYDSEHKITKYDLNQYSSMIYSEIQDVSKYSSTTQIEYHEDENKTYVFSENKRMYTVGEGNSVKTYNKSVLSSPLFSRGIHSEHTDSNHTGKSFLDYETISDETEKAKYHFYIDDYLFTITYESVNEEKQLKEKYTEQILIERENYEIRYLDDVSKDGVKNYSKDLSYTYKYMVFGTIKKEVNKFERVDMNKYQLIDR